MVDALADAGHDVFYEWSTRRGRRHLDAVVQQVEFDLLLTGDGVLASNDATGMLPGTPRRLDYVFNDIDEVVQERGRLDLDATLERERAWLVTMDRGVQRTLEGRGTRRVLHVPFALPTRSVSSGAYYRTRFGLRRFGWQRDRRPVDIPFARLRQAASGFLPRERTTELVFLGECEYGMTDTMLREMAERVRGALSPATSNDVIRAFDAQLPSLAALGVDRAAALADEMLRDTVGDLMEDPLHATGLTVFRARLLAQFRAYRRLELVRTLVRHFGPRFVLVGDHFRRFGLPALPNDFRGASRRYWRSRVAVDFGSNSFDCSIHPRVARVVACGACVVQREQADAEVWRDATGCRTFTTADEMVHRIERVLGDDSLRETLVTQQFALGNTSLSWRESCALLLGSARGP